MNSAFLGVGWAFPVGKDESGNIAVAAYEESVRQSVWLILVTARGERVMRPGFGCGIHEMVFANNGPATTSALAREVRQSLVEWEPRIDLLDVQATAGGSGEIILIELQYKVRATNRVSNLVYPFYLQGGAV